jgi:hypothetical protein
MAKGARSKVKRRWRALRREHVENVITQQETEAISKKLEASILGVEYRTPEPKNAFIYPNDPTAVIPKLKPGRIVDLRSSAIPGSGLQYVGARRKKAQEVSSEDEEEDKAEEEKHQMEVEKVRPKIGKIPRNRPQCKKSKKLIVF